MVIEKYNVSLNHSTAGSGGHKAKAKAKAFKNKSLNHSTAGSGGHQQKLHSKTEG